MAPSPSYRYFPSLHPRNPENDSGADSQLIHSLQHSLLVPTNALLVILSVAATM